MRRRTFALGLSAFAATLAAPVRAQQIGRASEPRDRPRVLRERLPPHCPSTRRRGFELVLNLKTARDLGVALPQSVSMRADRLIE